MGMGSGGMGSIFDIIRNNPELSSRLRAEEAARIRAEGNIPLGENAVRAQPAYVPPTQTSQYANPIPQYMPARFNPTPYGQAYEQQFAQNLQSLGQNLPPVQAPQAPISGLGALAQMYGMYNAAPQNAEAQSSHAASLAAAANTPI